MKQVNPIELKSWLDSDTLVQIIDIREAYEYDYSHIQDALSMPMSSVLSNVNKISKEGNVVMHCRTGKRAEAMIDYLEVHFKFNNLYNLAGGILAWSEDIDASVAPC